jgi:tRNA(fMet)-specific endonuclease VapC
LDTNVLSELVTPRRDRRVLERLAVAEGTSAIAALTWQELCYGMRRLPAGRRRDFVESVVRSFPDRFPVLPYGEQAADWHASERVRLEQAGKTPPLFDTQIAAVAVTRGLTLVTRNVRDFAGFTDLRVESWWSDPEPT